jgi:hypothetical protein
MKLAGSWDTVRKLKKLSTVLYTLSSLLNEDDIFIISATDDMSIEQPVAESLDRKYYFQPATGHCFFFCIKYGFAITIDSDVILNPW